MKKPLFIPLKSYLDDITSEERRFIDQEKRYYEVALALKKKRQALGLSQEELAIKANLPRTTITKVESGSRNTTLKTLMTLAQAMGSSIEFRLN